MHMAGNERKKRGRQRQRREQESEAGEAAERRQAVGPSSLAGRQRERGQSRQAGAGRGSLLLLPAGSMGRQRERGRRGLEEREEERMQREQEKRRGIYLWHLLKRRIPSSSSYMRRYTGRQDKVRQEKSSASPMPSFLPGGSR